MLPSWLTPPTRIRDRERRRLLHNWGDFIFCARVPSDLHEAKLVTTGSPTKMHKRWLVFKTKYHDWAIVIKLPFVALVQDHCARDIRAANKHTWNPDGYHWIIKADRANFYISHRSVCMLCILPHGTFVCKKNKWEKDTLEKKHPNWSEIWRKQFFCNLSALLLTHFQGLIYSLFLFFLTQV